MAKAQSKTDKKKAGQFTFAVESVDEAEQELRELRSGRGGRTSKYQPIADAFGELPNGKSIKVKLNKNEVGGLRGYLSRHYGNDAVVKSSKVNGEDDTYLAFIFHQGDADSD